MPNLLSRLRGLRPALTRRAFWLWAALITLLRCAVTHFQLAYMWAGGAPLDDELMFRAANAITSGQWLGEYDYLTLSKSMFFAVWLALLNKLHLPYLLGGALLWCAAALLAAFALRPLWRKSPAGQGRALTLLLYALLRLHIVKGKVIIFVNSLELWGRGARVRRRWTTTGAAGATSTT